MTQALPRFATSALPLAGQNALVTGAGRGLGEAICRSLTAAGARVLAADIDLAGAEKVAASLAESRALSLDVSDAAAVEQTLQALAADLGHLDIVVNNAGIDYTLSVEQMSVEQFDRVLAVNLRGPFLVMKAAFTIMKAQGGGQIVNIASTAAKRAWANASAYHASKWGLLGLSHALHVEGRSQGIKVSAVISGGMRTPFLLDRFPDLDPGLLQDPANVAETVRFLLTLPAETVIPEITVLPMRESSWP